MSKLATFVVAVAALVLAFVTLSPSSAEAGWRRGGHWGGPGVNVYVGPRWGWYAPRYRYWGPRLRLRLPLRLLSLLARALLARLVLSTSASKALRSQRAAPERAWPFGFARGFLLNAR